MLVSHAAADVYRCREGGRIAFSDSPCEGSGERIKVAPAIGQGAPIDETSPSAGARAPARNETDRLRAISDRNQRELKLRDTIREIERTEKALAILQDDLDRDLMQLALKKRRANNNLAGATWEASISTEMEATTTRYKARMDAAQSKLNVLIEQRTRLEGREQ